MLLTAYRMVGGGWGGERGEAQLSGVGILAREF